MKVGRVLYEIPEHRAYYVGNPKGCYAWIGWPYWAGIRFAGRDGHTIPVHLQDLLCCQGPTWRIKFRWFVRAWATFSYRGPWLMLREGKLVT